MGCMIPGHMSGGTGCCGLRSRTLEFNKIVTGEEEVLEEGEQAEGLREEVGREEVAG